jgi:peptidoglycan/xylan/chitin deacetylase (PgdA/CDA1 family)
MARRAETSTRRSRAIRGAAIVFHEVAPIAGDHELEIDPPVGVANLDAAVGHLTRSYALVRAAELPSAARERRPGEPLPVAVTFDDDLPSHHDHALPVLQRHGAVATAFVCAAPSAFWWQLLQIAVDTRAIRAEGLPHVHTDLVAHALRRRRGAIGRLAKAIEDLDAAQRRSVTAALRDAVPQQPAVLGKDGVSKLAAAGWEIGFHTSCHDLLTTLDDDALREALRCEPEALHGVRPRTLAYPHGKATAREAEAAREAGYVAAYTGRAEALTDQTDVHLIGRLQPSTSTLGSFALSLARALSAR